MLRNKVFQNIVDAAQAAIAPTRMTQVVDNQSLCIFRLGGLEAQEIQGIAKTIGLLLNKQFKSKPKTRSSIAFDESRAEWQVPVPTNVRLYAQGSKLSAEIVRGLNFVELWLSIAD